MAEAKPVAEGIAAGLGLPAGTAGRACILQLDDGFPKLDLTEFTIPAPAAPLTNADVGVVRICLLTETLAADVASLKAQGVAFLSAPVTGDRELADVAVCKDPDGSLIELLQVYLDRWQPILAAAAPG